MLLKITCAAHKPVASLGDFILLNPRYSALLIDSQNKHVFFNMASKLFAYSAGHDFVCYLQHFATTTNCLASRETGVVLALAGYVLFVMCCSPTLPPIPKKSPQGSGRTCVLAAGGPSGDEQTLLDPASSHIMFVSKIQPRMS